MTVKALIAKDPSGSLTKGDIPLKDLQENDVLINIHYTGICHTDLHMVHGEWPVPVSYPMVPGHEIVGTVLETGKAVKKFKVGDKVGVGYMVDSCRECNMCKQSKEQFCDKGFLSTSNGILSEEQKKKKGYPSIVKSTYGGYSSSIVVSEDFVLSIPDMIPFDKAAPLLCAGITMYSPLNYFGAKKAGQGFQVGIIGLGGLGEIGAKISKAMGNTVTIISTSERKKEYAENTLGVKYICSGKDAQTLKKMSEQHGNKFDLVLSTISSKFDPNPYLELVRKEGKFVFIGVPPEPLEVDVSKLIFKRMTIGGSIVGGIKETQEMLEFCCENKIWSDVQVISCSQVLKAYKELQSNTGERHRFVLDVRNTMENNEQVEQGYMKEMMKHKVSSGAQIIGTENVAGKTYNPQKGRFE